MKRYLFLAKWYIIGELLFSTISDFALAFMPYCIKVLFDSFEQMDIRRLLSLACFYVGCIVISLVAIRLEMIFSWKETIKVEMAIKQDFFKRITNYRFFEFNKYSVGEYLSMQSNELSQLELDYFGRIVDSGKHILSLLVYGFVLFAYVDWKMGIVIVTVSVLVALLAPKVGTERLSRYRKEYLDKVGNYTDKVKDLLEGFLLIHPDTKPGIRETHDKKLMEMGKERYHYGKFHSLLNIARDGFYI